MTPPRAAVIGIGNPYRRDDGIGPALVSAFGPARPPGVALMIADGEPGELLDAWSGMPLAIVVDAVRSDRPVPGRIHRTALDLTRPGGDRPAAAIGGPAGSASTHGFGIPDAVRLAQVLDRLPRRLVVFAVEAADTGLGTGLSPAVEAALPDLVQAVLAELSS